MKYKILVNKENKIKENFLKRINLVEIKDYQNKTILIEEQTKKAYLELQEFLKTKNIYIEIDSAYRSEEYQQEIYDYYKENYGLEYANKIVAPIGTSEHHTGLAIDINLIVDGKVIEENNELLKYDDIYQEIHKYLKDFGFILRYPKDKEKITKYPYEPWHIRYIGKIPAKIIYENNWTLEEYLSEFNGIVVINKEKDMTSFDVVNEVSKVFGIKKVGHTGTLDPLAEGVLIVAIGKATKIVELLTAEDKEYIAEVKLGIKTDTLDITGEVLEEKEVLEIKNIKQTLNSFKKTYLQQVPIYSAVKVNGKKLYEYARNNQEVTLPKKEVTIKKIELLEETTDTFKFKTLVTKGCYIRSLIEDICTELNTIGTMTSLIRTKQGKVTLEDSITLKDLKEGKYKIKSIDESLNYKVIEVNEYLMKKITSGHKLNNTWNITDKVIFKFNDKLLGIYQINENDILKVWKNFI